MRQAKERKKQLIEKNGEMQEKLDLEIKKEIAKIAMTATLGVTVGTAPFLKKNKFMKNIHTGAGMLLVGFSLWHHLLYQTEKNKKIRGSTHKHVSGEGTASAEKD